MDLTWTLYQSDHRVRFVPEAVSYPIEPHNFDFMCLTANPIDECTGSEAHVPVGTTSVISIVLICCVLPAMRYT